VDARSGAAEIVGLDDRGLIERFSKRSEEIHERQLAEVCSDARGRLATRAELDAALGELVGPQG
jgi:hypothetical protein